jgi:mannose-6-phosphate isomerase class I
MSVIKILGRVRDYDWGRSDKQNLVFNFSSTDYKEQKYAELWMGSHPSAPALIGETTLTTYLKKNNLP